MNRFYLLLLLLTVLSGCKKEKVIMVVLAHPDDETTIGPMMSGYARTQKLVYIVASDGRYGDRYYKITEDSLIKIRKSECQCSAKALGILPPVFLDFHDNFGIKTSIGEYFRQTSQLKDALKSKILEIKPDQIITFGPDGDTGHSDHRIIGNILTELILREGWYDQYPLYYLGWTKEQAAKFGPDELGYLKPKYFNVAIVFDQDDENRSFESIRCYKSQYSLKEMETWINTEKADSSNTLYFRKFSTDKTALKSAF